MNTPPQNATISKTNHVNIDLPEEGSDVESCMTYSNYEEDNVQEEYYSK